MEEFFKFKGFGNEIFIGINNDIITSAAQIILYYLIALSSPISVWTGANVDFVS